MASLVYDSFLGDLMAANVVPATDTYKIMLVNGYVPNKSTHAKRSDVTNEALGTGYTAGGIAIAVTLALDTTGHKETLTWANVNWPSSTITATGAVIYKSRGGVATADNLVGFADFGATISTSATTFSVNFLNSLTFQN